MKQASDSIALPAEFPGMTGAAAATTPLPGTLPARHLLDIAALGDDDIQTILTHSAELQRAPRPQSLAGRTVAIVFYEASTRTRVSVELAAKRLGAEVIIIQGAASSATKGESLLDTMHTLAAMDVDCIILRHPQNHAADELAVAAPPGLSIINAGDGTRAHPSQALLDVFTVQQHGVDIPSSQLTIVGDIRHSRVARSNLSLWQRLGVRNIRLAGPEQFLPDPVPPGPIEVFHHLDAALSDSDVVMMLRIQRERISGIKLPDNEDYFRHWGLNEERLRLTPDHCRVLHPGPMNRGVEITSAVADGPRSLILDQVRNGVLVRMAILNWCLRATH